MFGQTGFIDRESKIKDARKKEKSYLTAFIVETESKSKRGPEIEHSKIKHTKKPNEEKSQKSR